MVALISSSDHGTPVIRNALATQSAINGPHSLYQVLLNRESQLLAVFLLQQIGVLELKQPEELFVSILEPIHLCPAWRDTALGQIT